MDVDVCEPVIYLSRGGEAGEMARLGDIFVDALSLIDITWLWK